jgi:hypothetical protein
MNNHEIVRKSVWDFVWGSVEISIRTPLWKTAARSVGNDIWHSVNNSVWFPIQDCIRFSLSNSVEESAKDYFKEN